MFERLRNMRDRNRRIDIRTSGAALWRPSEDFPNKSKEEQIAELRQLVEIRRRLEEAEEEDAIKTLEGNAPEITPTYLGAYAIEGSLPDEYEQ